jgi:hypothetical protein
LRGDEYLQIPEKVKIGGHIYDCKLGSDIARDDNALGRSCGNAQCMWIDNTVPHENQESTLLHEIIEQINYRYELGLEHKQISILEAALYQVIKDNPEIFHVK